MPAISFELTAKAISGFVRAKIWIVQAAERQGWRVRLRVLSGLGLLSKPKYGLAVALMSAQLLASTSQPPIRFDRATGVLEGANARERGAALAFSPGRQAAPPVPP